MTKSNYYLVRKSIGILEIFSDANYTFCTKRCNFKNWIQNDYLRMAYVPPTAFRDVYKIGR